MQVGQVRVGGGVVRVETQPIAVIQGRGDEVRAGTGWGLWERRGGGSRIDNTWD